MRALLSRWSDDADFLYETSQRRRAPGRLGRGLEESYQEAFAIFYQEHFILSALFTAESRIDGRGDDGPRRSAIRQMATEFQTKWYRVAEPGIVADWLTESGVTSASFVDTISFSVRLTEQLVPAEILGMPNVFAWPVISFSRQNLFGTSRTLRELEKFLGLMAFRANDVAVFFALTTATEILHRERWQAMMPALQSFIRIQKLERPEWAFGIMKGTLAESPVPMTAIHYHVAASAALRAAAFGDPRGLGIFFPQDLSHYAVDGRSEILAKLDFVAGGNIARDWLDRSDFSEEVLSRLDEKTLQALEKKLWETAHFFPHPIQQLGSRVRLIRSLIAVRRKIPAHQRQAAYFSSAPKYLRCIFSGI